ncbi:MAG: conjugal transfer protein TraD [Phenylobacterium sp.]|nr:MAG: conjugal transfer protein TraD [Phenylobacterium sp.]
MQAARRRLDARRARADTRSWVVERRDRTRRLIELGGLVQKAGLVDLTGDDRAALLGGLLVLADQLVGPERQEIAATWRHRGRRAFEADLLATGKQDAARRA